MIIKVILSYIIGYVKVKVEGYYIERFINICTNNKIVIWNLKRDKNVNLYLNVRTKDFKYMVDAAKKTIEELNSSISSLNKEIGYLEAKKEQLQNEIDEQATQNGGIL